MRSRPDVLVLGGGVLGEAWMMGVLAGIEDGAGFDLRDCEAFVGTSAGSIVAAHLVAGNTPRRPSSIATTEIELGSEAPARGLARAAAVAIRRAGGVAVTAGAAFAPLALGMSAPGGALLRSALLRSLSRPSDTLASLHAHVSASGARFDGRLRVVAVDRATGRRVVFGRPGAPAATVADAVAASCTVPWLFAPVAIGGREYVDGGVWSPTNLDAAPVGRDTHVLCLNCTASLGGDHPLPALVRNVARTAAAVETLALRNRGARVRTIAPSAEAATAMGLNYMDSEPRIRVLAAGYRQGLRVATAD
ncbi:MAG TPA: patatin-like phospholipase family protein [Solirubrobacteraceae bacterium]|nr:patatin-like phospholipase family protein [Solirubrobacteraceae bacterium]